MVVGGSKCVIEDRVGRSCRTLSAQRIGLGLCQAVLSLDLGLGRSIYFSVSDFDCLPLQKWFYDCSVLKSFRKSDFC